jgi:hypothetical protein
MLMLVPPQPANRRSKHPSASADFTVLIFSLPFQALPQPTSLLDILYFSHYTTFA